MFLPGIPAGPVVGPSHLPDFSVAAFTAALAWSTKSSARGRGRARASASRLAERRVMDSSASFSSPLCLVGLPDRLWW